MVLHQKELDIHTHHTSADASMRTHVSSQASRPARIDDLRAALLSNVDLLYRRRAAQIGDDTIDEYLALQWLEWNGGALRLTVVGQNICEQIKAGTRETI